MSNGCFDPIDFKGKVDFEGLDDLDGLDSDDNDVLDKCTISEILDSINQSQDSDSEDLPTEFEDNLYNKISENIEGILEKPEIKEALEPGKNNVTKKIMHTKNVTETEAMIISLFSMLMLYYGMANFS